MDLFKAHMKAFWRENESHLLSCSREKVAEIAMMKGNEHAKEQIDFLQNQVMDLVKIISVKNTPKIDDAFDCLSKEEMFLAESIIAARKIQTMLWGESNGAWGLEEWRRMFVKRFIKIEMIDPSNPHAIVELKKRLLQNAALSIALTAILHYGHPIEIENGQIPSNLPSFTKYEMEIIEREEMNDDEFGE
jgi:hypothetical protein